MYISFFSCSTRWILSLVAYLTSTAFSFSNTLWIYLRGWFPTVPITYYNGESAQYSISSTLELDLTNQNRPGTRPDQSEHCIHCPGHSNWFEDRHVALEQPMRVLLGILGEIIRKKE